VPDVNRLERFARYVAIVGAHVAAVVGIAQFRRGAETQRFIGDRYDRFLFRVSQLRAAVRSGLVRKADVQFPLSWYVEKRLCGHKKLLLAYIAVNSAPESAQYFESLDAWQRCAPG
jgi:hypothetical protein